MIGNLNGFTIVETLIFLAVTGVLFVSAITLVGGQQQKTEFTTGMREIQTTITDLINNVSTGYYNNTANFTCSTNPATPPNGRPIVNASGSFEQGTNADCILAGRAIQFGPVNRTGAQLYTLIGRRQTGINAPTDVRNINEAYPITLDMAETHYDFPNGITIKKVTYSNGTTQNVGTLAFITTFGGNSGSGGLADSKNVDLIPVPGTTINDPTSTAKQQLNQPMRQLLGTNTITAGASTSIRNPDSGITLCFEGGANQHATLQLGGSGRQRSTDLSIGSGTCP